MKRKFQILLMEEALTFLSSLGVKEREKMIYNLNKARVSQDPTLFKKLRNEIWEFRVKFNKSQFRFLAFWDKSNTSETLVIATHGFIKKTDKLPRNEIEKAENLRKQYLKSKNS